MEQKAPGNKKEASALKFKRAGILTILVIAVLIVWGAISYAKVRSDIRAARAENAALEQQLADKETENAAMSYAIENSDDPDVIEDIARDKLGYVLSDEQVFYAD